MMGFWATVELLMALEHSSHAHPFEDEAEDWMENVSSKVKLQLKDNHEVAQRKKIRRNINDSVDYGNLVECSLSYKPVRNRLERLMGSCVVRLTDRKFMTKLIAKIREEYEAKQEARVQERKWKELMRTKNMILTRFISIEEADSEILNCPLFQLFQYCDSLEKRSKKVLPRKVRISPSLYEMLYPSKTEGLDGDNQADKEDVPMKEVTVDGETKMVPLSPAELIKLQNKKEREMEIKKGYMFTQEDFDNLHYEAEAIKKLKATKTVNDMYKKAHEIVGALYSFKPNEPRKRCGVDEFPLDGPAESYISVEAESLAESAQSEGTENPESIP